MADVSVNIGVQGLSKFKQEMTDAQASVKTFDAAIKANAKNMESAASAEEHMQAQASLLNGKLQKQKEYVQAAQAALQEMEKNGIKPTSSAYQNMQRKLIEAQSAMVDTQKDIESLGTKSTEAKGKTDKLGESLGGLNKKASLQQVITSIDKVTGSLEKGAKAAIKLGKSIVNEVLGAGGWADDLATTAKVYGISTDELQRMQKTAEIIDTDADTIIKARNKLLNEVGKGTKDTVEMLEALGIKTEGGTPEDIFWATGQAIMNLGDEAEKEAQATKLFGKSWHELIPLFSAGREEYERINNTWSVVSEEQLASLQEMDDSYKTLKADLETLKMEALSELAKPMSEALQSLSGLLNSEEGKEAAQKVIGGLKEGLGWMVEHKAEVVASITAIGGALAALKVTSAVLNFMKLIQGVKGLAGGGTDAAAAGAAIGKSWGAGFASAVMKAAPWLAGLYTLLKPSEGSDSIGDNTLIDANGKLTKEAEKYHYKLDENGELYQDRAAIINEAAQKVWDLDRTRQLTEADLKTLQNLIMNDDKFTSLMNRFMEFRNQNPEWQNVEDIDLTEWLAGLNPEITVDPVAEDGANAKLTEEIGTVKVPVVYVPTNGETVRRIRTPGMGFHANGLWSVPFDGYMAVLHKGERVVPAREVESSRNFTTNTYFENVNIQNGTDADGLAARVAAEQRRTINAFGG